MTKQKDIIYPVIDFGHEKIRVILASFSESSSNLRILGSGVAKNNSMKNGRIIDKQTAIQALKTARDEAESSSGWRINEADISIGGEAVSCMNVCEQTAIANTVKKEDAVNLICRANSKVENGQSLLHSIEKRFVVDANTEVSNPVGMQCNSLQVYLHLVSVKNKNFSVLCEVVGAIGIKPHAVVFSGLASSYLATSQQEREAGILAIDIGAGTTNFVYWKRGCPVYSGGIGIGGQRITQELADGLSISFQMAESLKCEYGTLSPEVIRAQIMQVPSVSENEQRNIGIEQVIAILEQAYTKIFSACIEKFFTATNNRIPLPPIVVTGGGSTIAGMTERFKRDYDDVQLRVEDLPNGLPEYVRSDNGFFTTLGMVMLWHKPLLEQRWLQPMKSGWWGKTSATLSRLVS